MGFYFFAPGVDGDELEDFVDGNRRRLRKIEKMMRKLGIRWVSLEEPGVSPASGFMFR